MDAMYSSNQPVPEPATSDRVTVMNVQEEMKSVQRVVDAYEDYSGAALNDVRRWQRNFAKLKPEQQALLSHLPEKNAALERCIAANESFLQAMLQAFEPPFQPGSTEWEVVASQSLQQSHPFGAAEGQGTSGTHVNGNAAPAAGLEEVPGNHPHDHGGKYVPYVDVEKVRCIIRNLVRDWGEEGARERHECYTPILAELEACFPNRSSDNPPSCLVPGAGLGRLACEISALGFATQGNEYSYYMLICSSFILNCTSTPMEWTIYPWIHSNCNVLSDHDQLRPVHIPDLVPSTGMRVLEWMESSTGFSETVNWETACAGVSEGFSMCAGDFTEVYRHPSQRGVWDSVVTCFFIDTAHNVIDYIDVIWGALKPGGVWINFGPLLYHYADSHHYSKEEEISIEPSLEDVKRIAVAKGFILKKQDVVETSYTSNQQSMMHTLYICAFWTMVKGDGGGEDASRRKDNMTT